MLNKMAKHLLWIWLCLQHKSFLSKLTLVANEKFVLKNVTSVVSPINLSSNKQ